MRNDPANLPGPAQRFSDGFVVKKLPVALALLAAASFALSACNDKDDDVPTTPPSTMVTTVVPSPCPSPSVSVSASPSVSVSVSVSASDGVKNDVPGDGGVAYHPGARRAMRPVPDKTDASC